MASSAWTAPRAELLKALTDAKTEAQAAVARMTAARAEAARLTAELEIANANREIAVTTLETVRAALRRQRLEVAQVELPPDPNAYQHRMTLHNALKEKP